MAGEKVSMELFLLSDLPEKTASRLIEQPEHILRADSSIYYLGGNHVLKIPDDEQGNEVLRSMIPNPYMQFYKSHGTADLYRQILTDSLPGSLKKNLGQFNSKKERCVIVFRSYLPQKDDLYSAFFSMIPVEEDDVIIPVRFDTVALVKPLLGKTMDDITEYSSAVIDTLEEEGFGCIKAGIGAGIDDIVQIRKAYIEAQKAIDIGLQFHGREKVFLLSRLTLETIIDSIPAERRKQIKASFFGLSSEREISEELLETVRVFFRNDLNLTATAKALFIHRNTLNYRLDKIQKIFDLDVRSFHDAVVFKIITDFPDEK